MKLFQDKIMKAKYSVKTSSCIHREPMIKL